MRLNKKISLVIIMVATVSSIVAFTDPKKPDFKNLKILSKNISHDDLGKIMHQFNNDLGVKCNFCHAANKENTGGHLDFASDEKSEKGIARKMMKMTLQLNKKYFEVSNPQFGSDNLEITCFTCHHGQPHPEHMVVDSLKEGRDKDRR